MPDKPRIFISYSRADGKAFARDLRDKLEAEKLPLWHDLVDMESGNWWHQIETTIGSDALEHVALIVTPAALASGNVAKEWRLARAKGVQVNLVQGTPDLNHSSMPKWMQAQHVFNLDEPEQWQKLIEVLNGPSMQAPVPFLPEEAQDKFIPRPNEYDALKTALLDDKRDAVAITAALKGAGGFGKTALAHALARDTDIREAFFDGVTFIQLGEEMSKAKLLTILAEQINKLTGEPQAPKTLGEAGDALAEALGEKHILLVIDDVWREFDLRPFLKGGKNSARLITTRMDEVLPAEAVKVSVDAMQGDEAVALLARGLPRDEAELEAATLRALAARLGEWPLLLELANGLLRQRVTAYHETLVSALAHANRRLDDKKLTTFDARNPVERNDAVAKSIAVSLEMLDEDERARFFELAIFPEDAEVPIDTIARLWHRTGRLDEIDTEDLLTYLASLSLLYSLDLQSRTARLHDVIRHYLRDEVGEEKLGALNNSFIAAQPDAGAEALEAGEKTYLYTWFLHHLRDADREDAIEPILLDPEWMQGKLEATSALALSDDYKQFGRSRAADLVGRCIYLTAGILERDKRELFPQLLGRMMPDMADGVGEMLEKARSLIKPPALIPHWPSFTQAGGLEIRRLEGHTDRVKAVAFSPDGRSIVSGAGDNILRLWDAKTGQELARFEGHTGPIQSVAFSPDGQTIISGSNDDTLLLWNVEGGAELHRFEGHKEAVYAVAFSPDGRTIISGSIDFSLRLWNAQSGECLRVLKDHTNMVFAVAFSPDGQTVVSGARDRTIRIWSSATGNSRQFEGHSSDINAVAFSPDGRTIVSGSADRSLRLWNAETGECLRELKGDFHKVYSVAYSPSGETIVFGSRDGARLWDIATGEIRKFKGHDGDIYSVAFSPDGKTIVSGSWDKTLRLWDITKRVNRRFAGHTGVVKAVAFSPNGRTIFSGGMDKTLRLWDAETGQSCRYADLHDSINEIALSSDGRTIVGVSGNTLLLWDVENEQSRWLEGVTNYVTGIAISLDRRTIVLGSGYGILQLWDVEIGQSRQIEGITDGITAVALSPNGQTVILGSANGTLHLVDIVTGQSHEIEGHTEQITSVAFSPDGRTVVSGAGSLDSSDNTLRLCDIASGQSHILEGHTSKVTYVAFLPNGRSIVSGSWDKTLRLWNVATRMELACFEGDSGFTCLALTPDGRILVAGDAGGGVHVFDIIT